MVARLLVALLCFVAGTICAAADEDMLAFATGGMARLPNTQLPSGDIHLGLRYQGDYRWKTNTFEHGSSVFLGWYSAF